LAAVIARCHTFLPSKEVTAVGCVGYVTPYSLQDGVVTGVMLGSVGVCYCYCH